MGRTTIPSPIPPLPMEDAELASDPGAEPVAERAAGRAVATRESGPPARNRMRNRSEPPRFSDLEEAEEIDSEFPPIVDDDGFSPGVHPLELLEGRMDPDAEKVVR